ncbi:helix-turn-helix domain-containing protein [Clostridium sp. UBA1652]|uniref:helix-turn-helix domain-containing protein n=1 Tax=Clostridium sp. UBA1652 TaxID=1946348 RepID=UPI00257989F1|nr:helix-turn-helix transcriptional regulator [Clostridium sp. UBA1652]
MSFEESVGIILKKYRVLEQLSQEELAFKVGLDRTYVGKIERGETKVTVNILHKLCNHFNIKLSVFFLDVENLLEIH